MAELIGTDEPRNPGSFYEFTMATGADVMAPEAITGYSFALQAYREQLAATAGVTADDLHTLGSHALGLKTRHEWPRL